MISISVALLDWQLVICTPLGFLFTTPRAGEVLTLPTLHRWGNWGFEKWKHAKGHSAMQPQRWEIRCTWLQSTKPCARLSSLFTHKPWSLLPPVPDRGSSTLSCHSPSDGSHCCSYTIGLLRKYPWLRRREKWGVGTVGTGFSFPLLVYTTLG